MIDDQNAYILLNDNHHLRLISDTFTLQNEMLLLCMDVIDDDDNYVLPEKFYSFYHQG